MFDEAKQIARRRSVAGSPKEPSSLTCGSQEVDPLAFAVPELIHIPLAELKKLHRTAAKPRPRSGLPGPWPRSGGHHFLMYQGFDKVANIEGGIANGRVRDFPCRETHSPRDLRVKGERMLPTVLRGRCALLRA